MKATELPVGAQVALYTGYGNDGRRDHGRDYGWERVRVVKHGPFTNEDLRPFGLSNSSYSRSAEVIVEVVDGRGRAKGKRAVLKRNLVTTWSEHVRLRKEARATKDAALALAEQRATALNEAGRTLVAMVGPEVVPWWAKRIGDARVDGHSGRVYGADGKVTTTDLLAIAQAAYAAGQAGKPLAETGVCKHCESAVVDFTATCEDNYLGFDDDDVESWGPHEKEQTA